MSIVVSATQELYCAKDDDGCVYCYAGRFCNRTSCLSTIGSIHPFQKKHPFQIQASAAGHSIRILLSCRHQNTNIMPGKMP